MQWNFYGSKLFNELSYSLHVFSKQFVFHLVRQNNEKYHKDLAKQHQISKLLDKIMGFQIDVKPLLSTRKDFEINPNY